MWEKENQDDVRERKIRQNTIVEIISEMDIETHKQLMDELKKRGIDSSQSTISRDLDKLGIIKSEAEKSMSLEILNNIIWIN